MNISPLLFLFLPFVLAFPCSNCPPNNAFTHTDLLSIPATSVEVMSHLPSRLPLQPPASLSETTIMPVQPAADTPTGHVLSIPTRDPSPFYHDHQSSWRSEDITNVLLAGITALAALLALGIKYIFMPRCARGQQSGQESTDLEALELSSGSQDTAMPLENVPTQSRARRASSDGMNEASATR